MYWAASCGGCDIAVLNVHEVILDVAERFDIVFWPAAHGRQVRRRRGDARRVDRPDPLLGRHPQHRERGAGPPAARKSKVLVAFGSCACEGCIPGLANLSTTTELLDARLRGAGMDNPDARPGRSGTCAMRPRASSDLPGLLPAAADPRPGRRRSTTACPAARRSPPRIAEVLALVVAALDGTGDAAAARLGPRRRPLDGLRRVPRATRNVKQIDQFGRHPGARRRSTRTCACSSRACPATARPRATAAARSARPAGAPCIGCYGPADGVVDYGARLMSAFASVVDADEPDDIERILDGIARPGRPVLPLQPGELARCGASRRRPAAAVEVAP